MIYLKKICVFYLLAKVLLRLCPKETYETYLNALIQWTVLLILLVPLFSEKTIWSHKTQWERWLQGFMKENAVAKEQELPHSYEQLELPSVEDILKQELEREKEREREASD